MAPSAQVPRIKKSAEVRVTELDQKKCLGRPVLEHDMGEARKTSIDWLIRHLRLSDVPTPEALREEQEELARAADYQRSRRIDRPQARDVIDALFTDYVELKGDGRVAADFCIAGGVARLRGALPCVVVGCMKGHSRGEMQAPGTARGSHGRLLPSAERFVPERQRFADKVERPADQDSR